MLFGNDELVQIIIKFANHSDLTILLDVTFVLISGISFEISWQDLSHELILCNWILF